MLTQSLCCLVGVFKHKNLLTTRLADNLCDVRRQKLYCLLGLLKDQCHQGLLAG